MLTFYRILRALPALFLFIAPLSAQGAAARELPARLDPTQPRLVVRLLPGASVAGLASALGAEVVRTRPQNGIHLLSIAGASASQIDALAIGLKGVPTILYAEADEQVDPPESLGCGPPEGTVGAQQCTIAFIDGAPDPGTFTGQYALQQIQGEAAHLLATGVPLVVAVVDTGVELSHPLFAGRIAPGGFDYLTGLPGGNDVANGVDDDADGMIDEAAGHGTHVAGLIVLADPAAMILPLRALDSDGNGSAFLVAAAIYDAVDQGATVINLSLSTRQNCEVIAESLMYAEYYGVQVVTSAGNSGEDPEFPGDYHPDDFAHLDPTWLPAGTVLTGENLLSVTSVDPLLKKPSFACHGPAVDVATAGFDVYSAQLGGSYAWWSGTSMSAGIASGSVSFLLSIWGDSSYPGSVMDLVKATATDVTLLNPFHAGGMGDGVVNLLAATTLVLAP